jgi:branched-chain amino acid transport system ATP-binding protein
MSAPLLEVRGLEAGYGSARVLFGIDLAVGAGEVVGLLGRNGMGKTTTVRAVAGLLPPRAGEVWLRGQRVDARAPEAIARLGLGLVPEGRQIFPNLTVGEHLRAFAADRDRRTDPWTFDRVIGLFPRLGERLSHLGGALSGGEQQMLAIGRALTTNPHLLVLDEATEGLAPLVREQIWACLRTLKAAGQSILVIDKHVEVLAALADRTIVLERGQVAWTGTAAALAADRTLWHRYLGV